MARNHYSSEKAIYLFFNKNLQAYKPISYYHECFANIPILILYGDKDWAPVDQGQELVDLIGEHAKIDYVTNSGHMLCSDNHEELTAKIIEFSLLKKEEENLQSKKFNVTKGDKEEAESQFVEIKLEEAEKGEMIFKKEILKSNYKSDNSSENSFSTEFTKNYEAESI